jgi:hypothetical protein
MEDTKEDQGLVYREIERKGFSYHIHGYVEWNDYICLNYYKDRDRYFVLHHIPAGKTRVTEFFINDLGSDMPWLVSPLVCADENGLYEIIDMFSIDRYIERMKEDGFLKPSIDKYEELRNLPEDTNPIIFYYEFK